MVYIYIYIYINIYTYIYTYIHTYIYTHTHTRTHTHTHTRTHTHMSGGGRAAADVECVALYVNNSRIFTASALRHPAHAHAPTPPGVCLFVCLCVSVCVWNVMTLVSVITCCSNAVLHLCVCVCVCVCVLDVMALVSVITRSSSFFYIS
jgi:hypothetical protein